MVKKQKTKKKQIFILFRENAVKKTQNAPRPSEHPPVRGGGDVKTFRWDHRLQIQNLSMAFKRVPRW